MTQQHTAGGDPQTAKRRTVLKTVGAAGSLAALGGVASSSASAAAGTYTGESYGGFGSSVSYYGKYVPSSYDGSSSVPLVVMLHGCTQTADGFKDETQMNQVAEEHGFIVVYPETTEHSNDCWRWFNDSHTTRGNGEAADIKGIVDEVKNAENIDGDRVYVAGFSAGGGSTADVLTEYADVFAACGTHSGFAYDVVESEMDGTTEMSSCSADPVSLGEQAKEAMDGYGITSDVPTVVFHGTADYTVDTCNGHNATEQAVVTNDLVLDSSLDHGSPDTTTTVSGSSSSATKTVYEDDSGNPVVSEYIVDGMDHAWAGGASGGSYTDPGAPSASEHMWNFFSQWTVNGPSDGSGPEPEPGLTASASASPSEAGTGESITFDASDSTYTEGSIESFQWEFGDGTTASGATVTHSYSSEATFDVTLTVTAGDLTDTDTVSVTISDAPELYCGSASNSTHVDNGRAYQSWGCYYAEGSGDYLGCMGSDSNTLEETSEGYFTTTDSCDGSGGGGDDGGDDGDSCWYCW